MPVLMKVAKDILAWPDESLDDGTPLGQLLLRMRRQMNQQLADATDKLAAWHDLGCEGGPPRLACWQPGSLASPGEQGRHPHGLPGAAHARLCSPAPAPRTVQPAEIAALPARQEATLDHVWEHHAARVPDEFDVRDLMAATPLGSPDLASAWFALAPVPCDPLPEG